MNLCVSISRATLGGNSHAVYIHMCQCYIFSNGFTCVYTLLYRAYIALLFALVCNYTFIRIMHMRVYILYETI